MSASPQHENTHEHLRLLAGNLDSGALSKIEAQLNELHPAEIANLLESLPLQNRRIVWELTNPELAGDILVEVNDEVRLGLIEHTDEDDLVAAVGSLDTDDLADIFEDLPKVVLHQVVRAMSNQDRRRLQSVMSYDEDSAGGLMNPDMVTIRPNVDLGVVLRYLRQRSELPANTDKLFVVDRDDRYLGILNISDLLTTNSKESVSNTMITEQKALLPTLSANEVALFFEDYNLVSAPVVDEDNRLLGRITVDDVVDVLVLSV